MLTNNIKIKTSKSAHKKHPISKNGNSLKMGVKLNKSNHIGWLLTCVGCGFITTILLFFILAPNEIMHSKTVNRISLQTNVSGTQVTPSFVDNKLNNDIAVHPTTSKESDILIAKLNPPPSPEKVNEIENKVRSVQDQDLEKLEKSMLSKIEEIRTMKFKENVVIENSEIAQSKIRSAQSEIRQFLLQKYGPGPYYVQMKLKFPETIPLKKAHLRGNSAIDAATVESIQEQYREESILIELAPIEHVPYSVYFFLENVIQGFHHGAFHRNAGHVLQAKATIRNKDTKIKKNNQIFAWQEYSENFPHAVYTLGYAGRPSSNSAFYISTVDNTRNHGPGSQGSKTEADR